MLTYFILSAVATLSIMLNIFLLWFVWKSLKQIANYDEELRELIRVIKNFSAHLQNVHDMEMFYGDETLRHLMRHATDIIQTFEVYDLLLLERKEEDDDNYEPYSAEETPENPKK